jgi:hypothetical protein
MDKPTIFTILVALLQLIIAVISISGKLIQEDIKRLTNRGHFVVGLSIVLGFCTVQLFFAQKNESDNSEIKLKTELRERDSIYKKTISEERIKYAKLQNDSKLEIVEALAKYGLKYSETENKVIDVITEEAKNKFVNSELILLSENGIIIDSLSENNYKIKFQITSKYASSYNINLNVTALTYNDYDYTIINYYPMNLLSGADINVDSSLLVGDLNLRVKNKVEDFVFYLTGDYKIKSGKQIKIHEIYCYHLQDKSFRKILNTEYLISIMKKNKIYKGE